LKRWQFLLGLIVSAFFLWLALRGLHLEEVWQDLQEGNYLWLIPSVGVYFLAVLARTWRWDFMLRPLKRISIRRLFPVVVIGYMGNNIYPFRAGELLRSYVLYRREGVPVGSSLATVVVERVFDGLVMLLFVFLALPFTNIQNDSVQIVVNVASLAFFAALLLFFLLAAMPERAYLFTELASGKIVPILLSAIAAVFRLVFWSYRLLANLLGLVGRFPLAGSIGRLIPVRFRLSLLASSGRLSRKLASWSKPRSVQSVQKPLMTFTGRFLTGLESLRSFRNVMMIFGTSIVIWLLETVKYWFVMQAFNFEVSFYALMLMNGVVNLATTLPSAPGYIGTFDGPGIWVLHELYRVELAMATAYTLVLHAALWLPITLLGFYYMIREGMSWSDFGKAVEMSSQQPEGETTG
jgi:uncharacterized membrane protein YbhN (UPF0104 family)